MAYKKYIRKNGKVYGPYTYHSKRVGDKVIFEYHGLAKKKSPLLGSKIFLIIFGIFIVLFLGSLFIFSNSKINPSIILDIKESYEEGEILKGKLDVNLKSGEFIPASSKVIFINEETRYEYILRDLIEELPVEGEYYVEGSQVSGFGEGYGEMGAKETYPDVYFKLNVYSKDGGSGGGSSIIDKDKDKKDKDKDKDKDKNDTKDKDDGESEEDGKIKDKISGAVITGEVSLKFEKEVQGDVSYGREFRYSLREGESVEVVEGSVKTETVDLSSKDLDLIMDSEGLVVTTSYFELEEGFGEDYLYKSRKSLSINISSLDLMFEEGSLKIYVVYEGNEIIFLDTYLKDRVPISQISVQEEIEEELSIEDFIYPPLFRETFYIENISLNEKELAILLDEFPNQSIQRSAKEYKKWILVEFKLLEYSVEYSYDSSLDFEVLEKLMEKDRIMWLKDLARKFLKEESSSEELINFTKSYDFS